MPVIFVEANRKEELLDILRSIPAMIAGKVADRHGIANGIKTRMAFAWLSIVKESFIEKARGGVDEAGISWPPLSKKYLAYGRGPKSTRTAGGKAPPLESNDGFMTQADWDRWWRDYRQARAMLTASLGNVAGVQSHAAAIAWNRAKKRGVKTKLEVFGNREVEILRDRGILFNSLSPGILTGVGDSTSISKPAGEGGSEQILEIGQPGIILVGTNVPYAEYHQTRPGLRKLWPEDGNLPTVWTDEILEVGLSGLMELEQIFK